LPKLYKKRGKRFLSGAITYLMKTYDYPTQLKPKFQYNAIIDGTMGFSAEDNIIYVNLDRISDLTLTKLLGVIRHEFRHFEQFVDTLRCPTIWDEAIDFYAVHSMVNERLNALYKLHKKTNPKKKFNALNTSWDCINYYEEHPEDPKLKEKYKKLKKYREIAVQKLGWIIPNTEESKRVEKIFAEHKTQELRPAGLGEMSLLQYQYQYTEADAFTAQKLFENQITGNKKCLFSILKESNQKLLDVCTLDDKFCKYLSKDLKDRVRRDEELLVNFINED
jgi:hypothetical protein